MFSGGAFSSTTAIRSIICQRARGQTARGMNTPERARRGGCARRGRGVKRRWDKHGNLVRANANAGPVLAWDYLLEERAVLLLVLWVLQKVLELRDEVGDRELPARRSLKGLDVRYFESNKRGNEENVAGNRQRRPVTAAGARAETEGGGIWMACCGGTGSSPFGRPPP